MKRITPDSKYETAAILTIRDPDKMDASYRHTLSLWLRRQARFLESHGHKMSKRFTAKYLFVKLPTIEELVRSAQRRKR